MDAFRAPSIRSIRRGLWALALPLALQAGPPSGAPRPAPPLATRDLQGKPFSLADLKGKVVLVDFWASWCGPCRKSLPFLDQLQAQYGPRGFQAVGVALDDTEGAVMAFLEQVPVRAPIVSDPSGASAQAFGVVAMPTSFLIDAQGRIVARFEGGQHLPEEEAAIRALLEGGGAGAVTGHRVAVGLEAKGSLKAWRRGHLADPIMDLDGDRMTAMWREHIHASKEGAAGTGGAAGGGCGCN